MLVCTESEINIHNCSYLQKIKDPFTPVDGDSITSIAISIDECYLGVGTDAGMIKIYKVDKLATDNTHMHVLWQTHTNRVMDLIFMKTVRHYTMEKITD